MAKALLILSIILTLLTAGLGYVTKQKVDELQQTLKSTKTKLTNTENTLKTTQNELKSTQDELTTTKNTVTERETEIAKLKGDIDAVNSKLKETEAMLADRDNKIKEAEASLAAIQQELSVLGEIKLSDIPVKFKELNDELTQAKAQRDELQTVKAALEQQKAGLEGQLEEQKTVVKSYKDNISIQGVTGKILAYNPNWNFVVVSIGDKQGLRMGANLIVKREGQMVARLKVTSVEPSSAIADVVPGSLARGNAVQPGDQVIVQ